MSNVMGKLQGAKPVEDRNPFIDAGPQGQAVHKLAIMEYRTFNSTKHGEAIACDLLVLESEVHPVGSVVFSGWFINRAPAFPGDNQEVDRAVDFLAKLVGGTTDDGKALAQYVLTNEATQPLRGRVIVCTATRGYSKKKKNADGTAVAFIEKIWTHVAMTDEQIAGVRAHIDAKHPLPARTMAPVAPPAQYAPAPVAPPAQYYPAPTAPAPVAPPPAPPAPAGAYPGLPPGIFGR